MGMCRRGKTLLEMTITMKPKKWKNHTVKSISWNSLAATSSTKKARPLSLSPLLSFHSFVLGFDPSDIEWLNHNFNFIFENLINDSRQNLSDPCNLTFCLNSRSGARSTRTLFICCVTPNEEDIDDTYEALKVQLSEL